jgi:UDP-N-acetylmuramoyl-tripeptide--D-alanyl-D-alanine ligase
MLIERHPRLLGDLAAMLGGLLLGDPDSSFGRVVVDSRLAGPGDVFVALPGERTDGHRFAGEVIDRGGFAVVRRNGWPEGVIVVDDPLEALWKAARARRAKLEGRVIGVTGSNGKTTTREMIALGLSAHEGLKVGRSHLNYNNEIGLPLSLLNLPLEADFLVLEMGMNHAGELSFLGSMARPHVTVVTSVGRAHMEFFEDHEAVARAKAELLTQTDPGGGCVIPVEEPVLLGTARERGLRTVTVGDGGDVWLEESEDSAFAMPERVKLELSLPGRHNRSNALFALSACTMVGIDSRIALKGMAGYSGMPGRGRSVRSSAGFTILDESYNANPDSVLACLELLREFPGDRGVVLGEMRELGEGAVDMHREVLEYASGLGLRFMILVGEAYEKALELLGGGSPQEKLDGCEVLICESASKALAAALEIIREGDTVLVKGSHSVGLEEVVSTLQRGCD